MTVMEEPTQYSLKEIIRTLQELSAKLDGDLPDDLPGDLLPEVAERLNLLRENERSLLDRLAEEREEHQN